MKHLLIIWTCPNKIRKPITLIPGSMQLGLEHVFYVKIKTN